MSWINDLQDGLYRGPMKVMQHENLNEIKLNVDPRENEGDYARSAGTSSGNVEVVFDNLEDRLIAELQKADAVVGCVAWLTNERILKALADLQEVQIIVQKEDFLRPDIHSRDNWKRKLQSLYAALPCHHQQSSSFYEYLTRYGMGIDYIQPIRCLGNHNSNKAPAHPRMHHKFIVLFRLREETRQYPVFDDPFGTVEKLQHEEITVYIPVPYAVWTGSFNFTQNGTVSLENAVIIRDAKIANAYLQEWRHAFGLSEPLDWESEWVASYMRVGS